MLQLIDQFILLIVILGGVTGLGFPSEAALETGHGSLVCARFVLLGLPGSCVPGSCFCFYELPKNVFPIGPDNFDRPVNLVTWPIDLAGTKHHKGKVSKKAIVSFLTSVLAFCVTTSSASAAQTQPAELRQLIEKHEKTLQAKEAKLREDYLAKLENLQKRMEKRNKKKALKDIEAETVRVRTVSPVSNQPASRTLPRVLRVPRATFDRQLAELREKETTFYLKQLANLEARLRTRNSVADAKMVAIERENILVERTRQFQAKAKLPKTRRELERYLPNTVWTLTDDQGRSGTTVFTPDGMMTTTYHPMKWETTTRRQMHMMHPDGHWTILLVFSEDMTRVEGFSTYANPDESKPSWKGKIKR